MPTYQSSNGFGTGPQPDPMPAGADRLAVRQTPPGTQLVFNQPTSEEQLSKKATRPEIPKKNKHLEEICRLKQQLSELQSDHDHIQDSFERMALDMDETEQKLVHQTKELEEKEAELTAMQKTVTSISAQLDHEKQNQASVVEKLKDREKSTQNLMEQQIDSLRAAVEQKGVKEDGDVSRLQAEVLQLTSAVAIKNEELKNREAVAAESGRSLTGQLQAQTTQLEEQIKLREKAEAALAVQQQQASTGLEIAELRRLCNFYQENSQRLSKQINLGMPTRVRN